MSTTSFSPIPGITEAPSATAGIPRPSDAANPLRRGRTAGATGRAHRAEPVGAQRPRQSGFENALQAHMGLARHQVGRQRSHHGMQSFASVTLPRAFTVAM